MLTFSVPRTEVLPRSKLLLGQTGFGVDFELNCPANKLLGESLTNYIGNGFSTVIMSGKILVWF
jgi:hypothetical protein